MNNEEDPTEYSIRFGNIHLEVESFEQALEFQEAIINSTRVDILKRVG